MLFLDEPTTGLDPRAAPTVGEVSRLRPSRQEMLLTTQYLEEADQLAQQIAMSTRAGSWPKAPPTSSRSASVATG